MMKRLNILELHRTINEKNARKHECYDKVLDICHKKIVMATEHKKLNCFFEVPEYICGYPIFNLSSCIKYMIDHLQMNGFLTKYIFPKYLYISWDFEEIKQEKNKDNQPSMSKPVENKQLSIPNIPQSRRSNLQPLQSSFVNNNPNTLNLKKTGKLELNLY